MTGGTIPSVIQTSVNFYLNFRCHFGEGSIHLFLPQLAGGQFHVYRTARSQNAVYRIFALLTYQNSNTLFYLQLLLALGLELLQASSFLRWTKTNPWIRVSNLPHQQSAKVARHAQYELCIHPLSLPPFHFENGGEQIKNKHIIGKAIQWRVCFWFVLCHLEKPCGRRGGLMVSTLDSRASAPGSSPGRGHWVVFLGMTLNSHGASLHPGV